ncbi:hypothetical protein KL921_005390 [Ogataea angusta]|uniref:Uncharacterized protein n=1 Tax=Pichia angusta TaxID=870730 RepID=A0AAN6DAM8_PICAN|nr:uncharacterized protein KL928_005400 [Ogataea angusta]KAG7805687.1 hypothetical protein KL921_005390 [Ogataea angusta]KAG7815702.1 hypothetical protein KL928_005400 [Ogataea angusta]KAG7816415.1 hypothetical protein KL909_005404 [Ogataea angusta]KAG7826612.1 hypothetical protein KL920_005409 [Ogataea angusta]KAG7828602.1 hypothetical protein KL943_005396 [Ogataea angusta]
MFDRYFKYLESKEDQLSTQFLKDTLAGSGKIGVQILSKYKCVGQEKLINEADEPEVYLMDFKVNNQSKPIIKFGKSPYSRMRLKNMEAHRKILKIRYDSTTEVGRRSKSKKDTNKGSSQYTRLFATPFTDAQIEDVYVS